MTKEEQQAKATLNDHIVIHKVTDHIFAMHKDGTSVYAVDVIKKPLVRCKECRYWEMRNSPRGWCVVHQGYVSPQYFCADGERKESE